MDVELLNKLAKSGYLPTPTRPDNFGFTIDEYMKHHNCTHGAARLIIENMVDAGIIESTKMSMPGKAVINVYHPPGDWKGQTK